MLGLGEGGGHVSDEEEEEDIVLALDEPEHMPPRKRARIIQQHTQEQLSNRTVKCGYHHGLFNPLPSTWSYPKGLTVIQLMNLWLIGSKRESVPPFRRLSTAQVAHFDAGGKTKSKMNQLMKEVEYFARVEKVWLDRRWTSPGVTKMWSTIWPHLEPHMRTLTKRNGKVTDEKSRQGQISWRTVYNKFMKDGKNSLPSKNVTRRAQGVEEV